MDIRKIYIVYKYTYIMATCEICNLEYNSIKINSKYCSNNCSKKAYYIKNKQVIMKKSHNKYKINIQVRLASLYRAKLRYIIFNNFKYKSKMRKISDFIGCSRPFIISRFEKQFPDGCNWSNHGKIWEIDHIKPINKYDLTDPIQLKKCFHYTNLRPLLKKDNRGKYKFIELVKVVGAVNHNSMGRIYLPKEYIGKKVKIKTF